MIRRLLTRFFCNRFYPTNKKNWYKKKGYHGCNDEEIFANFIEAQRQPSGHYSNCFDTLSIERFKFQSGQDFIDAVRFTPQDISSSSKAGAGKIIIMFQGRLEYYESRFRDMSLMAKHTGATVIGFNPKGFHSSTGKTRVLKDIVDDGIALVQYLLSKEIAPENIVMIGNSLGGGVQEMVCKHFRDQGIDGFKQINSNSFKYLSSVVAHRLGMPFAENFFHRLLKYSGWEIEVDESFFTTGQHRCVLRRYGDRTIIGDAEYYCALNPEKDIAASPKEYRKTHKWLLDNCQLILPYKAQKDPHIVSLHKFDVIDPKTKKATNVTVFDFINRFLAG